jgi:hypothetical protein
MRTLQRLGCIGSVLTLLVGCIHINRPNVPPVVDSTAEYSVNDFQSDYKTYTSLATAGDSESQSKARVLRDHMVNRVEVDIEKGYREFEQSLTSTHAGFQTGADVVELGLSAAIGTVGAVDVKDLLAASLTGFKGTRLSFDKNVFREKTTEILISRMQGARDGVRNRITQKLASLDVRGYSFDEAWHDLIEYFYAGTLPSAFQQLANDAGQSAVNAQDEKKTIDINRANTAADLQTAVRMRTKYAELYRQAADPATRDATVKQLQDILLTLGDPADAGSTDPTALLKALRTQMGTAASDPEKMKLLEKVVTPQPQ